MRESLRRSFRTLMAGFVGLAVLALAAMSISFMLLPDNPAATIACKKESGRGCRTCCVKHGARVSMSGPLTCSCAN